MAILIKKRNRLYIINVRIKKDIVITKFPNHSLQVRINSLLYHQQKELGTLNVVVGLFHGTKKLDEIQRTESVPYGQKWNKWFEFTNVPIRSLPLSARKFDLIFGEKLKFFSVRRIAIRFVRTR